MRTSHFSRLSLQLLILDTLFSFLGLYLSAILRSVIPFGEGGALPLEFTKFPWQIYCFAAIIWPIALASSGAYDPERVLRWYNEALRVLAGVLIAAILLAGMLYMTFRETSRLQFIYFAILDAGLLLDYRAVMRLYYRARGHSRLAGRKRILVLGAGELGRRTAHVILDHSRWGLDLIGFLDDDPRKQGLLGIEGKRVLGEIGEIQQVVRARGVDEVWIALPARALDRVQWVVRELEKLPARIKVIPDFYSLALITAKPEIVGGIPVIGLREPVIEGLPRLIKRVFDVIVSSLTILLLLPVYFAIAVLIRLTSPGPVLFRQQRVGENGVIFEMLKFRTMEAGAEARLQEVLQSTESGELVHKAPGDPRVTKVGKLLRRLSLDELPQLFNVLKGDMSLVGPRPEMPWLVDRYDSWQRRRFAVPQGITGWWQINGRSDKPMHLNTEDDLYYVYNYSLLLDIQILLRTPMVVLRGKGAF